ncbi:MAG TPA: hypothetical protein DCK93_10350 [Blastocatellia bacterium]|nr:hypothetical protein [Blastocatellia bacterium]
MDEATARVWEKKNPTKISIKFSWNNLLRNCPDCEAGNLSVAKENFMMIQIGGLFISRMLGTRTLP